MADAKRMERVRTPIYIKSTDYSSSLKEYAGTITPNIDRIKYPGANIVNVHGGYMNGSLLSTGQISVSYFRAFGYIQWRYAGTLPPSSGYQSGFYIFYDILYNSGNSTPQEEPIAVELALTDGTTQKFGARFVDTVSTTQQQLPSSEEISAGVMSSYGDIELRDVDNSIYKLVMDGKISGSGQDVSVYYYGDIIGKFKIESSNYDYYAQKLKLTLKDELADWDNKTLDRTITYSNLYTALSSVLTAAGCKNIDEMLAAKIMPYNLASPTTVKSYLQSITYTSQQSYNGNEQGTSVRQVVDSICEVAQLCCYLDVNGKVRFASVRPVENIVTNANRATTNQVWQISPSQQNSSIASNLVLSNKYDSATIMVRTGEDYALVGTSSGNNYKQNSNNYFLTSDCKFGGTPISTVISNNVVADYDEGIRAGDVDVTAMKYYDPFGNSSSKTMLELGDVVSFTTDDWGTPQSIYRKDKNVYWKVRGRQFDFSGVGKIKLQLQELAYTTDEPLADSAPRVSASVFSGNQYFRTYATVSWTAVNAKVGANVSYDVYINDVLSQTVSGLSVEIDAPKEMQLNIFVKATDTSGQYLPVKSNVVYVTIPPIIPVPMRLLRPLPISVPYQRQIEIPAIPDATSYVLKAHPRNSSSDDDWETCATYETLSESQRWGISRSIGGGRSQMMTFRLEVKSNKFPDRTASAELEAANFFMSKKIPDNFSLELRENPPFGTFYTGSFEVAPSEQFETVKSESEPLLVITGKVTISYKRFLLDSWKSLTLEFVTDIYGEKFEGKEVDTTLTQRGEQCTFSLDASDYIFDADARLDFVFSSLVWDSNTSAIPRLSATLDLIRKSTTVWEWSYKFSDIRYDTLSLTVQYVGING